MDASETQSSEAPASSRRGERGPEAPRRQARERVAAPAGAFGLFVGLCALTAGDGIVLTPQGLSYVAAADSLLAGRGLEIAPDALFARFAPLYAWLLAALGALGFEPVPALHVINSAAFAGTLLALTRLAQLLRVRALWAVLGFQLVLASQVAFLRAARPDGLVVCLAAWAFVACARYAGSRSRRAWFAAVACCALAALGRYMALFSVLPIAGLALLACERNLRDRVRSAALFTALAGAPVAAWLLRNKLSTGFVFGMARTGNRPHGAETDFLSNCVGLVHTIWLDLFAYAEMGTRGFVYDGLALELPQLVVAGGGLALLAVIVAAVGARRVWGPGWRALLARPTEASVAFGCATGFALWYAVVLIALWSVGNNDPINTRYVAPIYPFALLALSALADGRLGFPRPAWPAALLMFAGLLIAVPNIGKSIALFADPPSERLVESKTRRALESQWVRELSWGAR